MTKSRIIIQKTLQQKFPDNNIVIHDDGSLEFDYNDEVQELEITHFASGVVAGIAGTFNFLRNESVKS